MAHAGDVIENPVTGQRLVFLITSADSDGELFAAEGIFSPGGFAGVPHVHPHQDERFEVRPGMPRLTSTAPTTSSERATPSTCPEGPVTPSPTPGQTRCASGLSFDPR